MGTNLSQPATRYGMGWLPDYPDFRDYTAQHENVAPMLAKAHAIEPVQTGLSPRIDLREWFSPVED